MNLRYPWLMFAAGALLVSCAAGCSGGSSSGASSSSTSGSSSGGGKGGAGGSAASSSSSGAGGGASSSSSSSSSSGYATCSDCTHPLLGAPSKECKAALDSCEASADCVAVYDCGNQCAAGDGCCTLKCFEGAPPAAVDLFKAYDGCIYCQTCKALCNPDFDLDTYCKYLEPNPPACP